MMTIQDFTSSDLEKLKATPRVLKLTFLLLLVVSIPLSLIVGLFGRNTYGYLLSAAAFFCLQLLIFAVYYFINYTAYQKDLRNQKKIVIEVRVIEKSNKKGDNYFRTDDRAFKKIDVLSKAALEKINIGDVLTIEIAKQSKLLLKVERGGLNLLNGG